VASAETVRPGPGPLRGASPEEAAVIARWIERPGSRMVRTTTPWASPAAGAAAWREWAARARDAAAVPAPERHADLDSSPPGPAGPPRRESP